MGTVGTNTGTTGSQPKLPDAKDVTHDLAIELRNKMGQDGDEAGIATTNPSNKLYVNSGKSFNINKFLNTDGKSIKSENTDWDHYIDKPWVKNAIKQIDAGMKPLPESVKTYRYLSGDSLGYMTGLFDSDFGTFINKLESGTISGKDFSTVLQNTNYVHKGFSSTTYEPKHGTFDNRDIKLNMVFTKGTPAIVTNNHKEHEILGGRNLKYNFTGGWKIETTSTGKHQLVLDVYV